MNTKKCHNNFFFENLDNFQNLTFLVIFWIIGSKTSSIDLPKIRGMGIDRNLMSNRSNTYSIKSPKCNEKGFFEISCEKKFKKIVRTKCEIISTFCGLFGSKRSMIWDLVSNPKFLQELQKKQSFFPFRPWRKIVGNSPRLVESPKIFSGSENDFSDL